MATEVKNLKISDGWVAGHTVTGELLVNVENGSCYAYFGAIAPTGVEGANFNWNNKTKDIHYIGTDKLWIHARAGTCTVITTDETGSAQLAFATQLEVDAGTLGDRAISPLTFTNSLQAAVIATELAKLNNHVTRTGMLTMVNAGGSVDLITTYIKIPVGGTKVVTKQNGNFDYNATTQRIEVVNEGYYQFELCGSVEFPVNSVLELSCFVDGIEYSPDAHLVMQGRGAGKPVQITLHITLHLTAGQYVEMFAKMDVAGTLLMLGNNSSIEKKVFDVI